MSAGKYRAPTLIDAVPLMIVTTLFVFVAVINWDYQRKFFEPFDDHGHLNYYLGPVLLGIGYGFALVSCVFYYLMRGAFPRRTAAGNEGSWVQTILAGLVSMVCLLMSLGLILLGPAALTMLTQMNEMQARPGQYQK